MRELTYDVAIIGAGVVGCAVFREYVLGGFKTILIERDADIINGASKANSAILHTGFDATPGTLEAACVKTGYTRYHQIHHQLGLPLLRFGALLAAWSDTDLQALDAVRKKATQNGVGTEILSADEMRHREPGLSASIRGGISIPGESVVDSWSAPLAYARQAIMNGGTLLRNAEVLSGARHDRLWTLNLKGQVPRIQARLVVNCSGLQGDIVEAIVRPSPFHITPRKGQFLVFDKSAYDLVQSIILPVPTKLTKGVVVTRTAYGNLLVGPTAEPQNDRRIATTTRDALLRLRQAAQNIIPDLQHHAITTEYAGLRPATEFSDYQIEALPDDRWISVSGIRSTGLTGALGIASHVRDLHTTYFGPFHDLSDPQCPVMTNITQCHPRAVDMPGRSTIVCHCEMVTEDEIKSALHDPILPAGSVGGLRRRTRCMMGRCQGFYCTRRVTALAAGCLPGLSVPIPTSTSQDPPHA